MGRQVAMNALLFAWIFAPVFGAEVASQTRQDFANSITELQDMGDDIGDEDEFEEEEDEDDFEDVEVPKHIMELDCTVIATAIDSWLVDPADPSSLVTIPKVEVRLHTPMHEANFSTVFATRYGSGRSQSPPADYGDSGPQGWLRSMRIGERRMCFQPQWDPVDVRLEVESMEGDRNEFMMFLNTMHSPLGAMAAALVVFTIGTLTCVRCYRDPGIDVKLPWVRRWCMAAFPVVLLICYFTGFGLTMTIGSGNLQHKFYQPLLFGIAILFWISYFSVLGGQRCWNKLATNMTLVFGVPCYFMVIWTVAFVALVPGFNWMMMIIEVIKNTLYVYKMCGIVSAVIVNLSIIVGFLAYKDKILRAFGIDAAGPICPRFDEIFDPSYRGTHFIAVKMVVLDIVGKLPSGKATCANNLFVQVHCCGNEPTRTRVHIAQEAQTAESMIYPFHEVLQVAIPMDPSNIEYVYITVMDEGILGINEIARAVVPVNEIFAHFLSPRGSLSNMDKEIRLGNKVTFWDKKGDGPKPVEDVAKAFELTFQDFAGPSYMWLAFLPGNEKTENYLHSLYNGGVLRKLCCCCFGAPAGVGHVDEFDQSEYAELADKMEKSSFQSLTASGTRRQQML